MNGDSRLTPLAAIALDSSIIFVDRKDVVTFRAVIQHVAIFVRFRDGLGLNVHQQGSLLVVHWTRAMFEPVKIHMLSFPLFLVVVACLLT
jgi:hypothetical protein